MNHDGQFGGRCQAHLAPENFFLHLTRRMIVVVIQPDLSPSNYLGMPRQVLHALVGGFVCEPGFVGMDPESRVHEIVFLRQLDSAIDLRGAIAVADGDHGLYASLSCAGDHLFAVGGKLLAIEMCVRVNEHSYLFLWGQSPPAVPVEQGSNCFDFLDSDECCSYFNFAPTGTSSKKPANTGLPPSSDAATIIPFDSRPRNLRGARFATITTLRPISVSGA